ncbi:hypothetical protein VKS41_007043 [Umbelopsis sp. WA50703]|jgi:hypothetical protein
MNSEVALSLHHDKMRLYWCVGRYSWNMGYIVGRVGLASLRSFDLSDLGLGFDLSNNGLGSCICFWGYCVLLEERHLREIGLLRTILVRRCTQDECIYIRFMR